MLRRVARFVLWNHIKATLWVSGLVVIASVVCRLIAHSAVLDAIALATGLLAAFILVLGLLLYRRRRRDGSP